MLLVAAGFGGAYYVLGTRSEASTTTAAAGSDPKVPTKPASSKGPAAVGKFDDLLARAVDVKLGKATVTLTWADLGVALDSAEVARTTSTDLAALGAKAALPIRVDRDVAIKALLALKAKHDITTQNAYLDLEERKIYDDTAGLGIDVWGSLPRIESAARQASPTVELAMVAMPARVTKAGLGIDDISHVMGYYTTHFPVTDRDRNFNLKLAASKINGAVLAPKVEWSFNEQVGERSEKEGYKIAHVINAGEMVDGLAGGTCQISTTLFGASFFAGLDIVKTTNHSRPSAYTPLGFDATVVWPNTDLKLMNPYDFPVVLHYRVANGEALVEVLGKERPYDKVVFERHVVEQAPFTTEERIDEVMPEGQTSLDQAGFNGFTLTRFRRFYKDKKLVHTDKWNVVYKPVTEYVRRGTNTDPDAKPVVAKEIHKLQEPTSDDFAMAQ
ncbi:MAG: VanW family protein [Proteobacteria bacterium]|nr:VanW family protein [Pseudomonadota bacterium]